MEGEIDRKEGAFLRVGREFVHLSPGVALTRPFLSQQTSLVDKISGGMASWSHFRAGLPGWSSFPLLGRKKQSSLALGLDTEYITGDYLQTQVSVALPEFPALCKTPRIFVFSKVEEIEGMILNSFRNGIISENNGGVGILYNFRIKARYHFLHPQEGRIECFCTQLTPKWENSDEIPWIKSSYFCNGCVIILCSGMPDVILYRTELVQMQKPQPVNPELTSWRFPGILDMLNSFRGTCQPCGLRPQFLSGL